MENLELGRVAQFFDEFKAIFERGKERIALNLALDESEIEIGTQRQRLRVNLAAPANENLARFVHQIDFAQIGNGSHSGIGKLRTTQNNGLAIRQRLADGLKRF